jgi:ferritin-like metal-binding protein YciE
LDENPKGKKCKAMEGLIDEGSEMTEEDSEGAVLDAGLIGAAQRVEHCEIAGCGIARFCRSVGNPSMFSLLEATLAEEEETDEKLTKLSEEINAQANAGGEELEEGEEEDTRKSQSKRKIA